MNGGIDGIRIACAAAGIRYRGRDDLAVLELAPGTRTAAVFTRNAFVAAPVVIAREHLAAAAPRLLLVNAGNANAGAGEAGYRRGLACCEAAAREFGCRAEEVLPFSTGVIGEPLPVARLTAGLEGLRARLAPEGWEAAARAIMTTDTVVKCARRSLTVGGRELRLVGIAKGAGMICPDMATMLAFIGTDAALAPQALEAVLGAAVEASFNRATIDGDTSTNDACVLAATGAAGNAELTRQGTGFDAFAAALESLCVELAQAIVADGEGATRLVTIAVSGARSHAEADRVARTVAHSPLVKTALYAGDPNWGRILAAVGRAGVEGLDFRGVGLAIGGHEIVAGGARAAAYSEAEVAVVMQAERFTVQIDLGRGSAAARLWTCDLSEEYVRINAEYRT